MNAAMVESAEGSSVARRLDRYELLAEIASGGMGVVLLARLAGAGGFQRFFAIKVMHPHLVDDPDFVAMLLAEARLAAKIHHPNVVATVDVGNQGAAHFIVMDYVEGFPLTRILDAGPFNRRERMRIVHRMLLDAMAGLETAHELGADDGAPLGIVHRDVSPDNILVGADGVGRVTDFGVALAGSHSEGADAEPIKGKPEYIAPEQAAGGQVDRRADVWALGVILWEALTGSRLFTADNEDEILLKVVSAPIISPAVFFPQIPPELEALCMQALDRDPARRPSSAREFAQALERATAPYGLLADAHEIAGLLRDRFGAELEARRKVIQYYTTRPTLDAELDEAPVTSGERSHWDSFFALPRLADAAMWAMPDSSPRPPLVNLESAPISRLRSTPAGTSAESLPPKSRAFTGVLALLALFGLGSLTTLVLLRFRLLNEVAPELVTNVPAVAAAPILSTEVESASLKTPPPPVPVEPAPAAAEAAPTASAAESPPEAPVEKAQQKAASAPSRVQRVPSRRSKAEPSPAGRSSDAGVTRAAPSNDVPGLTVEQNPYRLQ